MMMPFGLNVMTPGLSGIMVPTNIAQAIVPVIPVFPPNISGTLADLAAYFASSQYWALGGLRASFVDWMTAIGGAYTRSSIATYFQSGVLKTAASGVARFPTDLSGTPQGIRLTGPATNLAFNSNNFAATWANNGGTQVQNVTGPDGVLNSGWTFTAVGGSSSAVYQSVASAAPSFFSIFAKAGTSSYVWINSQDSGGGKTSWFKVSDGTIGTINSTTTGAPTLTQLNPVIAPLANGWYLVGIENTGATTVYFQIGMSDADTIFGGATAGNTAFVYGAQATHTALICDYVPTTGASATQAADSLIFPFSQATFSTLARTSNLQVDGTNQRIIDTDGNATIYISDSTHFATLGAGGVVGPAVTDLVRSNRTMVSGNTTNTWLTSDGLVPTTVAAGIVPFLTTQMSLGSSGGSSLFANGDYSELAVWNGLVAPISEMERLTNLIVLFTLDRSKLDGTDVLG